MDIRQFIEKKSKDKNIDVVGFTNRYEKKAIEEVLSGRKDKNMDTEFDNIPIDKRLCPEKILKDYKSIVSFAISYKFKEPIDDNDVSSGQGVLSKCSIGVDYHKLLREKIETIMEETKAEYGIDYRVGVDTSPLLDREIAKNSGIGYFGKNTNIINRDYGSFMFLGYALIDAGLDSYSEEDKDTCGSCLICTRSCPTASINGDYTINTRTCIAYLTQTKSKIPYGLREKMGARIYGCDTCQSVCPKNRSAKLKDIGEFEPVYVGKNIDLVNLINISNRDFKESYGRTSSGWRGRNVLRRNAIIAMGNLRQAEHIPVLEKLLLEQSDMIREYAIWSLLNIDLQEGRSIVGRYRNRLKKSDLDEYESILIYMGVI